MLTDEICLCGLEKVVVEIRFKNAERRVKSDDMVV